MPGVRRAIEPDCCRAYRKVASEAVEILYGRPRTVTRPSPARIGQRGVYEYPCTVSSKPRSDRDTVAIGNLHTSAPGVRSSCTSGETEISGQKKASGGNALGSQR